MLFARSRARAAWYRKMLDARSVLSDEEQEALRRWEIQHVLQGDKVTADWPGWEKHLGAPPWKKGQARRRRLRFLRPLRLAGG